MKKESLIFDQILEISNEGYKVVDKDFNIIYCNKKFAQFNDLETKDILGKKCYQCLSSNNCGREDCSLNQILQGKKSIQTVLEKKTDSNETRYFILTIEPFRDEKKEIVGIIECFIEFTAIKKAELALRESEAQLKKSNTTKDKLFSIIAHDLRSPFTSILGFSDLFVENKNDLEIAQIEEFVKNINSSVRNTLSLLDNLLNWAKTQTGNFIMQPDKIDLTSIIREVIGISKTAANFKNISLDYNQPGEIEIFADENMVKVVLRNLVSNAIKFTNAGGSINVSAIPNQSEVEITVSDNGVGMDNEKIKILFDISANLTSYGTANEKGSGLGLVLCKEFVEKLGGSIWVNSKAGEGSDFKFTLPLNKRNI
jgi:PAS domain S-box-containing protein